MTDICPHFGACGGCSRQDHAYEKQLAEKETRVRGHLAGLAIERFHPITPSPDRFYYRNKMEFSFGDLRDIEILGRPRVPRSERLPPPELRSPNTVHVGLHPKGRFALVTPTPDCRLISKDAMSVAATVSAWANENQVSIYTRKNGEGNLRHLVIREGKNTGERMVNLVAKSATGNMSQLAERLKSSGPPVTTFLWSAYDGISDVAGADSRTVFWGEGQIVEKLGRVRLKVTPSSFLQTNTHAAERLIDLLGQWAGEDLKEKTPVLVDLYCGSGALGLNLSDRAAKVIGIEIHPEAVRDARENAALNSISNAEFLEGRAEDVATTLPPQSGAVIVDPPRAGLHSRVVDTLLSWSAPTVYYVSCNPETLARDLRLLDPTYRILDVNPLDFFPHTDHVETAVRLARRM